MLKFGRTVQHSSLTPFCLSNANSIKPKSPPSVLRFVQAASGSPAETEMDSGKQTHPHHPPPPQSNKQTHPQESADTMSSFGEGYATRCDEEGFGGIYGGNQSLSKDEQDRKVDEFGHDQGSHVKEKEKARNQK